MGRISDLLLKSILCGCVGALAVASTNGDDAITETIEANRYSLVVDGSEFTGEGWDFLTSEAQSAHFFLIGEEHGIAENPILAAALFSSEADQGFEKLVIEVSPFLADMSWAPYPESGDPSYIFSFSGEGNLVRDVIETWPERGEEAALPLETLEETLDINRSFISGRGWEANHQRAQFLRSNFQRQWRHADDAPRVMLKLGSSHLIRGRKPTNTFDLGTLLPEVAQIEGVEFFYEQVLEGGLSVFDMRPLRPLSGRLVGDDAEKLSDVIHGYDGSSSCPAPHLRGILATSQKADVRCITFSTVTRLISGLHNL